MKFGPAEPKHARDYYLRKAADQAVFKAMDAQREHALPLVILLSDTAKGALAAIESQDMEALKRWSERAAGYAIRLASISQNKETPSG